MTELSKTIFDSYQVRKTEQQKSKFIDLLHQHIPSMTVETYEKKKTRNLIVGDPDTADILLTAHYDTCPKLFFPNFVMPKNPFFTYLYALLLYVPGILMFVAVNLLTGSFALAYSLLILYIFGFLGMLLFGPANRHTANDNTSGVITLCEIYQSMPDEMRRRVAFVFFDEEEKGLIGSSLFAKKHKEHIQKTPLMNFDCVSDGDCFLCVVKKDHLETYSDGLNAAFKDVLPEGKSLEIVSSRKAMYNSDQKKFPVGIAFAAFHRHPVFGYYMNRIHTARDTVFEEENISYLKDATLLWIRNMTL